MCGIVGILKFNDNSVELDNLAKAVDILHNRGPDDTGVWVEENIGLGHRRLSIIDTTYSGHQPMFSRDQRYAIVFNGEIYNYKELRPQLEPDLNYWQSNSDTEVILAAYKKWGPDCLNHFHGMFALAIWDRTKKVLFAARDRMGVKPFFYHYSNNDFAFSSRPKAIFAVCPGLSNEVDNQALRYYLESGYTPAPYSIFKSICKLPPAHYLIIENNNITIKRYWDHRNIEVQHAWKRRNENDLLDELDEIINRSIAYRLISDVPLGAFLSGGIDSSLVTAVMTKLSGQGVKTFTIGFEEHRFDESQTALAVSQYLGTQNFCEILNVNSLLNLFPSFLEEFDEPFFDSSAFPTMAVSRLARKSVKVSLSGDGGDELFGGYHYYKIAQILGAAYKIPFSLRKKAAGLINFVPNHQTKLFAGALKQSNPIRAFAFSRSIAKDYPTVLLPDINNSTQSMLDMFGTGLLTENNDLSLAQKGMLLDILFTLPDDYLQKVDVSSMRFSLESREPLLDHSLVEWAMKLPLDWKIRSGQNKYLLRKLLYRYIPQSIIDKPKHGFEVPIDRWLRGPLKSWAEDLCNDSKLFSSIPLCQQAVADLLKLHCSGQRNVHPLLWAILILLEFVRK